LFVIFRDVTNNIQDPEDLKFTNALIQVRSLTFVLLKDAVRSSLRKAILKLICEFIQERNLISEILRIETKPSQRKDI